VCVSSPTGSGKTLAFVLPSIQHILNRVETEIRVLVVVPVRDLALQVYQVYSEFCKGTTLKVGVAVGHQLLKEDIDNLVKPNVFGDYKRQVDILVATPGRLVDLIERAPGFSLKKLKILILDEADRMMNSEMESSFLLEIEKAIYGTDYGSCIPCFCGIESKVFSGRYSIECSCACSLSHYSSSSQPPLKLLFSATISSDPEKLTLLKLFQPILFQASTSSSSTSSDVSNYVIPTKLKEKMIIVKEEMKPAIIWYLVEELGYRKVICFTKSVESTKRLYLLLRQIAGITVVQFSSHLKASVRDEQLKKFRDGKIDVIICSDILARGMDIEGTKYVICYDTPSNDTAYVHRVGRTARAGKSGTSITLVTPAQFGGFQAIIRKVHTKSLKDIVSLMKLKKSNLKKILPKYKTALDRLRKTIKKETVKASVKKQTIVNSIE
ncbi:ATP-dependent RNA helicase DDX51-like protein, partial [Leptotrombidium deliense]